MQGAARPFRDLVDESLDEAAFLWQRWEAELTSLTRNLDDVWSWTEDRLHGAMDGVRVAGADLFDVAAEGLASSDVGRVAVSSAMLASGADRAAHEALMLALVSAEGPRLRAMVRGLEVLGSDAALSTAASALARLGPAHTGALSRLKAFRRMPVGDEVITAFKSNLPEAQAAAIRASVHLPSHEADEWISAVMRVEDPHVRLAAVESGLCRGIERAWQTARQLAAPLNPESAPYLKLVAMFGTPADHEVVYAALRVPALQRHAIWALGHVGTVRAAESCLAGMQYDHLARACGEAYAWITGAGLARDRLQQEEAPPDAPTFEDDDLEANLVPAPEELWPLPDREAVRTHWDACRGGWSADVRHVHGGARTRDRLVAMVETGPMLRRPDVIFELRARTGGRYDVEPRAFAARQRQMMAAGRAALFGGDA